jgi:hypothetical protein
MAFLVLFLGAFGLLALATGLTAIRASGASPGMAQRYAGAREHRVGDLLDLDEPPQRPVRVTGRVRCADPIGMPDGEALVAYHRDVELQLPRGGWRSIDRLRETRSFDLWDHDGSLSLDPALAAEPIVTIPHVWHGFSSELDDHFSAAVERLSAGADGALPARSVTRMVNTVDRLGVLALVRRDDRGELRLEPPPGGFIISTLELDAAMRLLGGPRRGLVVAGYAAAAAGGLAVAVAAVVGLLQLVA